MTQAIGKPTILVLLRYYLPGFKAGGPVRSIAGLVSTLGSEYDFKIICLDRDLGDDRPFPDEPVGRWYRYQSASVLRVPPGLGGIRLILQALRREHYDALYLNSVWERFFSIGPLFFRKLHLVPQVPLVLAPRGEFSAGAIGIKRWRKGLFLLMAKIIRLFDRVLWQASSEHEESDIVRQLGNVDLQRAPVVVAVIQSPPQNAASRLKVRIAPDLQGESGRQPGSLDGKIKEPGKLRIVTHGRVCKKKNIDYAIRLLKDVAGEVQYDIYGPLEDAKYVALCEQQRDALPANITVRFMGPVQHHLIVERLEDYHLFLLPTLGENFGHVIAEALQAGCVPLLSNTTPWRNLEEANAGWDFPLDRPDLFVKALQSSVSWSNDRHQAVSKNAKAFLAGNSLVRDAIDQNRYLFQVALAMPDKREPALLRGAKS
ncbi:MAG: glycosyltransferase [Terracidiphilus sp.]